MASSPRTSEREREEERRLNVRTLTIASAASATAAAVTSQLWIAGTWIAAAVTPVMVALISEAIHRPTERVARASRSRTSERPAAVPAEPAASAPADPLAPPSPLPPKSGDMRVYRQPTSRAPRRKIAIGVVAATAGIAFVIGIFALTAVDLVSGGSVGKGSGRLTFGGGGNDSSGSGQEEEKAPDTGDRGPDDPADAPPPETEQPSQTEPEPPPSDTAPVPPPSETPPGEPLPDAVP